MIVRRLVHRLGYRFRLHRRDLPGAPDIVLPRLRKIINVHGCFWHMHACKRGRSTPASNAEFWRKKRDGNKARDRRVLVALRRADWCMLVIWECQTRDIVQLTARVARFLAKPQRGGSVRDDAGAGRGLGEGAGGHPRIGAGASSRNGRRVSTHQRRHPILCVFAKGGVSLPDPPANPNTEKPPIAAHCSAPTFRGRKVGVLLHENSATALERSRGLKPRGSERDGGTARKNALTRVRSPRTFPRRSR